MWFQRQNPDGERERIIETVEETLAPLQDGGKAQLEALRFAYQQATEGWKHRDQIRWLWLNNYLLVNTVLVAGWAAIYASSATQKPWPILQAFSGAGAVVGGISVLYLVRSIEVVDFYTMVQKKLEQELKKSGFPPLATLIDDLRGGLNVKELPFRSRFLLIGVPAVFTALNGALLINSLG